MAGVARMCEFMIWIKTDIDNELKEGYYPEREIVKNDTNTNTNSRSTYTGHDKPK